MPNSEQKKARRPKTERTGVCRSCGAKSEDFYGGRKHYQYVHADAPKMETGTAGVTLACKVGERIEVCKACYRRWVRTGSMARSQRRMVDITAVEGPKLRALVDAGLSFDQIAAAFRINHVTARRWVAAANKAQEVV